MTSTIVSLEGDVDFLERAELRRRLEPLLAADRAIIDLQAVSYIDSSSLAELLRVQRERRNCGREPARLVSGTHVDRLLNVAGMGDIFPMFASVDKAAE